MTAVLEREYFSVDRDDEYFTIDGLSKMIGQQPDQWRHAALKEMVDNALDAAESTYPLVAPDILIEFTESENGLTLTVADNGPGIPADKVQRLTNFRAYQTNKFGYRAPTRGAQGNAIKTLLGIPVALGDERSHLCIESQGQRHLLTTWLTPAGAKSDHQQTETEGSKTRFTVTIPGPADDYYWRPVRWLTAYGLFNPHARLQIREIAPVWTPDTETEGGNPALEPFSDLSLSPTIDFPRDRWRKFLPTDPTPAHWYTRTEFAVLVHLIAKQNPQKLLGDFIQEFKGLSRVWRKVQPIVSAKIMEQLAESPLAITTLYEALLTHATEPKPEILGRVGPDHFRQRFNAEFTIKNERKGERYWYKHQWAIDEGTPYLIEVAIAETEIAGEVFYGLNYSSPFADPLAETRFTFHGKEEIITGNGLMGFLQEAGVYCGTRFGRKLNTVAAIHLVMPLLPTLDKGKTRLAISKNITNAIAEILGNAASVLTKESINWRKHQQKIEDKQHKQMIELYHTDLKKEELSRKKQREQQDYKARQFERDERKRRREKETEIRRLRGEKPTKKDVLFELFLPVYLEETENEKIRIMQRDDYYAVRPRYNTYDVRPRKNTDGIETTELDFGYFATCLAEFRKDVHKLPMIDYKARGTLFESHSEREIPMGDREMRDYVLPHHEYVGILFVEKEGVWATLKDTGGIELMRKYDLMVVSAEGYSTEVMRNFMASAQSEYGYKILAWHDADPWGYNICRTLAEPTERMPNHHLDVIDIGLRLEEGLEMRLATETFSRKKAIPEGILPQLTDKEKECFTGKLFQGKDKNGNIYYEWRDCQRIEINAIKVRDRVVYLEKKLSEIFQRKPIDETQLVDVSGETRPSLDDMVATMQAILTRSIKEQVANVVKNKINLEAITDTAISKLPNLEISANDLQLTLDTDKASPWRDIAKTQVAETFNKDVMMAISDSVNNAIRTHLQDILREAA